MATNAVHMSRLARPSKKLERPRPLNVTNQNRHSMIDTRLGTVEEIIVLTDNVASNLANRNFDRSLKGNIKNLNSYLKMYGPRLEAIYSDQLDRSFVAFRNGCRDESLDYVSRIYLLELIELRAMQWAAPENNNYYKQKINHDLELVSTPVLENDFSQTSFSQISPITLSPVVAPQQLLLGPGELVKSSGKYPAPTRVIGKNYCKDEVVIRNSDSGKVMGIKGRRVHMIEELSETVISFQRVNPGAKERLVQITGPQDDKINFAKQLMEETIRRNASPVRAEGEQERPGSSSSLNTDSDDSMLPHNTVGGKSALLHSFSTNDATLGEYKYTVTVGDESIKITGTNLDIVRIAKLVLDEYFSPDTSNQYNELNLDDGQEIFEHIDPHPYLMAQDSEESEETYKAQNTALENFEAKTEANRESPPKNKPTTGGFRYYTAEKIIYLADSPLSRQIPPQWPAVTRDFPSILRKTPIEWLDSASYLSRRHQEEGAANSPPLPSQSE